MTTKQELSKRGPGWRPPTRRAFVQMLAAAAAVVALRHDRADRTKPIWIGHF